MPPPPRPPPPYVFHFTLNSILNTALSLDDDKFNYEIVTRFWHPDLNKIFKLNLETRKMILVAEIKGVRAKGKPGKHGDGKMYVRFGPFEEGREEEGWMDENEFVSYKDEKAGGVFRVGEGVEYRWKTHKRRMQLISPKDEKRTPLVTYIPYKRHFWFMRMSKHASLEVNREVVDGLQGANSEKIQVPADVMDKIVVSYLLVERRRRNAGLHLDVKKPNLPRPRLPTFLEIMRFLEAPP